MSTILLLEDDLMVGKAVQMQLELEGFKVRWAQNIEEAQQSLGGGTLADLFLVDVGLPDGEGYDFCHWLRKSGYQSPVIFLSARVDEDSVLKGFAHGANDYIRKPYSQKEMIARIHNQLGDNKPALDLLRFAGLVLVRNQQLLKFGELSINLNRREFEILTYFFECPETIITREQLIQRLSAGDEIYDRTVDSHISHIRAKLQKNDINSIRINSVYGQGYRLEKIRLA